MMLWGMAIALLVLSVVTCYVVLNRVTVADAPSSFGYCRVVFVATSFLLFETADGQGNENCDRLIAAINAMTLFSRLRRFASDFACILTVTHMPHLKEAFQARIEVSELPTLT